MRSVDSHITEYNKILAIDPSAPPLIFGEANSLYNEGRPGLSNTFGAALWGVDFNLYSASVNIRRVHMHMGNNFRVRDCCSPAPRGLFPTEQALTNSLSSTKPGNRSRPT